MIKCEHCKIYLHKRDRLGRLVCHVCNRLWIPPKTAPKTIVKPDQEPRNVLFTNADKTSIRVSLGLPGLVLNPPKYLLYQDKLYQYRGSGGFDFTNFYREIEDFHIAELVPVPASQHGTGD